MNFSLSRFAQVDLASIAHSAAIGQFLTTKSDLLAGRGYSKVVTKDARCLGELSLLFDGHFPCDDNDRETIAQIEINYYF